MKELSAEDKELLLKDLCAKLPYGVRIWHKYYPDKVTKKFATSIRLADTKLALSNKLNEEGDWYPIEESGEILIKPYLRPMSSMTEEERAERIGLLYELEGHINEDVTYKYQDWLNKHHFDYRGLIPMGLAIAVTKENNPYE